MTARDTRTRIIAALRAPALVIVAALVTGACGSTPGPPAPSITAPSITAATDAPTPAPTGGPSLAGRYQPLWPFTDEAQARAWQLSYRSGGHQPWHVDPEQTALSFAQGYLGFGEIDRVVYRTVTGEHARVAVGHRSEESDRPLTAAVIHLVRYGTGDDAPWEVVGTDDTTLTLTTPAYGGRVKSPMTVGGRITGVDESIQVQVRRPWSATVSFRAVPGQTMTVVASTGGHIAEVERFAVTGVRAAAG